MRTPVPLLICSLLASGSAAQSVLTNGEIYDYQAGDVFQSKGQSWNMFWQEGPPHIFTDTILSREEINGGTGIQYTMKHWHVAYQYMQQPPLVTSSIDTLIVTDLDQVPDTSFGFCDPGDTLAPYYPFCGLLRWTLSDLNDSCVEEEHSSYWYYQGCGGPYYTTMIEELGGSQFNLIYVHKAGMECGTFWDLPTALPPQAEAGVVRLGPNPVGNSLMAQGIGPRGALIFNATGECVGRLMNGTDTDIGRLPVATYWLVGEDAGGRSFRMPIVKQ
jgi:hypothetical protein